MHPVGERRTLERHASDLVAACHPLALPKKTALAALVHDVSAAGLSLVLRYRFEPGTVLAIYLDMPNAESGPALARVIHAGRRPDGKWLLGCSLSRPLNDEQVGHCKAGPGYDACVRVASGVESFTPLDQPRPDHTAW